MRGISFLFDLLIKYRNIAIIIMSVKELIFYREIDGSSPVLEWLNALPKKVQEKAEVRIGRLAELGHDLKRPEADYLRDGIYELRWRFQSVNYRILYFFYGREVVVLAHGTTKGDKIRPKDIALAVERKKLFEANRYLHTYTGEA